MAESNKKGQFKATKFEEAMRRGVQGIKYALGFSEISLADVTISREEDIGFRRLTGVSNKELKPLDWERQMDVGHFLWRQNAFAFRMVELMADFVVGDGFTFAAKNPKTEAVLERHWTDPDNAWDMMQYERVQELSIFGSLMMKPFVNEMNGHVKLGAIDPAWVKEFIPDPDNPSKPKALKLMPPNGSEQTLRIIREGSDPTKRNFGLLTGEIFYFPVNKLTFTMRGTSDLFRIADWADASDQFLFHLLERIQFLNAHLYDIEIKDAGADVVRKKAKELELAPPKPGGFRIHNQKEKWTALAPKINSAEADETWQIVKMLMLGSMGIPEHWFAEGGNTNRATAESMDAPTFRKLRRRQAMFRDIIGHVLQYQVDQAIMAGVLNRAEDNTFEVIPPDISAKDTGKQIENLRNLTDSLIGAIDAELTDREQARKVWAAQASEIGVETEDPGQDKIDADNEDAGPAQPQDVEAPAAPTESGHLKKKRTPSLKRRRVRYGGSRPTEAERLKAAKWEAEKKKLLEAAEKLEAAKAKVGVA